MTKTSKAIVKHLDSLLAPLGFARRKAVWNRKVGRITDAFDIQVSKGGDAMTINIGVLDPDVHKTLWDRDPPDIVEPPACTVNIRIGDLIDWRDKWWPNDNGKHIPEILGMVSERIVPFFERMRTLEEMENWLANNKSGTSKFPAYRIKLAIIKYRLGKATEACELLADIQKTSIGDWRTRASEIAEQLGCDEGRR